MKRLFIKLMLATALVLGILTGCGEEVEGGEEGVNPGLVQPEGGEEGEGAEGED